MVTHFASIYLLVLLNESVDLVSCFLSIYAHWNVGSCPGVERCPSVHEGPPLLPNNRSVYPTGAEHSFQAPTSQEAKTRPLQAQRKLII